MQFAREVVENWPISWSVLLPSGCFGKTIDNGDAFLQK